MRPLSGSRRAAVFIATDIRVRNDGDGYYADHPAASYSSWIPYVEAWGEVHVVARSESTAVASRDVRVDGPGVVITPISAYHGLRGLVGHLPFLLARVSRLGNRNSIFVGRMPEPLSLLLYLRARILRARFVCLVVAEPKQLYSTLFPWPVGKAVGYVFSRIEKRCVKKAAAVVYVTERWLQELYPASEGTPTLSRSDAVLPSSAFRTPATRRFDPRNSRISLIYVGSMGAALKGHDSLIRTVALLRQRGRDVELHLVGDGRERAGLERLSRSMGLSDHVTFHGHLASVHNLRQLLDAADIFCITSRSEGLSRALIEAMARGLPAVATRAGGVEELVDCRYIADVDDIRGTADRIEALMDRPDLRQEAGASNYARAKQISRLGEPRRLTNFLRDHLPAGIAIANPASASSGTSESA